MYKKVMSVLLIVAVIGSLVVGCGKEKESSVPNNDPVAQDQYGDTGGLKLPIVDTPTTITWMVVSPVQGLNDKLVAKEIEKRTGIKLDILAIPPDGALEKAKTTVASGKLPDIMQGLTIREVNDLGAQDAIVAINDYLDELPNFKKLYVDNPDNNWVMKSYTNEDGKLYTWPIAGIARDVNHGFLYRKDIFDKNGIKEWTNTEEFYQALKKLKEIYPDSIPYASKTNTQIFKDWSYGWGIGGSSYPAYYDEKDGEWKLAVTSPEYKEMIDFIKKLYNEGLMDQEFLTDTSANWTAKMTQKEKSFVTFDWIGRLDMFYGQVKDQIPEYDLRYANPVGPTGHVRTINKIDNFGTMVANNKNKEVALKLLDYLTSPSGGTLISMGVEGVSYEVDGSGKITYPELKDVPKVDIGTLEDKYGCWVEGMYFTSDKRSVYFDYTEKEKEAQDKILNGNKFEPLDPILNFTNEENARIAEIYTSLFKGAEEFSTKYVLDKSHGEAEWNEWLKQAEKLGAKEFIEIYNAAQKRYDSAK